MRRCAYSGNLSVFGTEHSKTVVEANNYACLLTELNRFEEAKSLLRKMIPVARRVLGEGNILTLKMRLTYARTHYKDAGVTLGDLREAVNTLEETERTARRVLGGTHPLTEDFEHDLRQSRAVLHAYETGDLEPLREAMEAMTPIDA